MKGRKPKTITCRYCQEVVVAKRFDQVTCGKSECQDTRNRDREKERQRRLTGYYQRAPDDYSTEELDRLLSIKSTRLRLTRDDIWAQRQGWDAVA